MTRATLLALTVLTACSADESTSTDSLEIYNEPCDLSEIVAIDLEPAGRHYVVENGKIFDDNLDVTDILYGLVCVTFQNEMAVKSVQQGDWVTLSTDNATAGVLGMVTGEGDGARLIYETRTFDNSIGKLFAFRGEVLARSRSWTSLGSLFAPGPTDLALSTSFDQLVQQNPGEYKPLTATYTFR